MNLIIFTTYFQGLYFTLTGLWPIIHMPSFLKVTGSKTDLWLVRTVGLLIFSLGISLLYSAFVLVTISKALALCALLEAAFLLLIELYYVRKGVISKIYYLDSIVETAFILLWLYAF
jgi:hypothetical protein